MIGHLPRLVRGIELGLWGDGWAVESVWMGSKPYVRLRGYVDSDWADCGVGGLLFT